jgi:hypothetical protein
MVDMALLSGTVASPGRPFEDGELIGRIAAQGSGRARLRGGGPSGIRPQQTGAVSGLVNTAAQVGRAAGIALFGTVWGLARPVVRSGVRRGPEPPPGALSSLLRYEVGTLSSNAVPADR